MILLQLMWFLTLMCDNEEQFIVDSLSSIFFAEKSLGRQQLVQLMMENGFVFKCISKHNKNYSSTVVSFFPTCILLRFKIK